VLYIWKSIIHEYACMTVYNIYIYYLYIGCYTVILIYYTQNTKILHIAVTIRHCRDYLKVSYNRTIINYYSMSIDVPHGYFRRDCPAFEICILFLNSPTHVPHSKYENVTRLQFFLIFASL